MSNLKEAIRRRKRLTPDSAKHLLEYAAVRAVESEVDRNLVKARETMQASLAEIEAAYFKEVNKFIKAIEKIIAAADVHVAEHIASRSYEIRGKDGEPGRQGEPGQNGYTPRKGVDYFDGEKGDKGDKGDDGSPDTPEHVVEKINRAKEKINQSRIAGLMETIAEIKKEVRRKGGGGKSGGGMSNVLHEVKSVSSATTTVSTSSKIGMGGYGLWLYYNGQLLSRGVQYTVGTDQKTITFTFTLDDSSTVDIIYFRT